MYYDQLLALSRDYHILLVRVVNDYTITDSEKEKRIADIQNRLQLIAVKLKNYSLKQKIRYRRCLDKEQAKAFKKQVKHEFLTQAKDGYSLSEIMGFMEQNMYNPGINLEKYITKLRHPYGYLDEGYFTYEDSSIKNSKLVLTKKAERYLENEANVSLRK